MERYQPPHHRITGRGRGRDRTTYSSSGSSSSYYSSFSSVQSNDRTKDVGPSNTSTNTNPTKPSKNSEYSSRNRDPDDEGFPTLIGTCPFMCPVDERMQRERLRDLAVFERLDGNPGKSSSALAVKKFCRTISTKDMKDPDVRPLPVLEDTLKYLLDLSNSGGHSFEVVHEFIFDRTRSIRQDLSMQNIIGDQVVHMYERMVKFYIISHYKLRRCTGRSNISPMHHLNMEQLTKALAALYNLYEENRKAHPIYESEAEFFSFYVLLHLGSSSQPTGESLSLWFRQVPYAIVRSNEMMFSRRLLRYYRLGDYKRFLCSMEAEASYLQYCIIEPYVNEVRALALSCVNYGGHKLYPYPLAALSKNLLMEESDMESFCTDCGLKTSSNEIGTKFLPTKQTSCSHLSKGFQDHYALKSERLEKEADYYRSILDRCLAATYMYGLLLDSHLARFGLAAVR